MASKRARDEQPEKRTKLTASDDATVEVHKKSIEKILKYDVQIISKLDMLIAGQQELNKRLSKIEGTLNNNSNNNDNNLDPDHLKEIIKRLAKKIFEDSIYPSQDEFKDITENFFKAECSDFYKKLKKNQWMVYYERNISSQLAEKHRSVRGSFTSKVKESIHYVFGPTELPNINTQASASQIQRWKSDSNVKRCYNNLFKKQDQDQSTTFMSKIIERLSREKNSLSRIQVAYAISIAESYLCPEIQSIQIKESFVKTKIIKNLEKYVDKNKFLDDNVPASPSRDGNKDVDGYRGVDDYGGVDGYEGIEDDKYEFGNSTEDDEQFFGNLLNKHQLVKK